MNKILLIIAFFLAQLFFGLLSQAQITSSAANATTTVFNESCFIFCASGEGASIGTLSVKTPFGINSSFIWEKYDSVANVFYPYGELNSNDTIQSTIFNLDDGCYRVTIEAQGMSTTYQAWVLHNWIRVKYAEIPDSSSNCEHFYINADYEYAPLFAYNTTTGERRNVRNPNIDFKEEWRQKGVLVRSYISPEIFPPIASNSPVRYDLTIEDEFGCIGEGFVDYISKVTEAKFDNPDPMKGEAVLEVTFSNSSINYDSSYWFFYKDKYHLDKEIEAAKGEPVDSISFILTDDSPVYRYERSGEYKIRLTTVKVNETGNCYDTLYMAPGTKIEVDTSFISVPNVFTPNGDGDNDVFVIRSASLESLSIKIYNRWGGLVHSWKNPYVISKMDTYEHSVWDGRVNGGRMASPGVYYYVIQYTGRNIHEADGYWYGKKVKEGEQAKRTQAGFVHLFRENK